MSTDQQNPGLQELLSDVRRIFDERLKQETARLEKRARRIARVAIAAAILAMLMTGGLTYYVVYGTFPATTSPTLRARELVLVGPGGQERGYWRVDQEGTARLVMVDPNGVDRLKLTLRANGEQGVSMADSTGSARVVLGYLDDGSTTLAFADERGQTRSVLGLAPSEGASLLFADANGGTRAIMGVDRDGAPTFWWPSVVETTGATAADD